MVKFSDRRGLPPFLSAGHPQAGADGDGTNPSFGIDPAMTTRM